MPPDCRGLFAASVDEVRHAACDALATMGFKAQVSKNGTTVSGHTGRRWTSILGYGELIAIDLSRDIDVVRVTVTSSQNRGVLFDLADANQTNVHLILNSIGTTLHR